MDDALSSTISPQEDEFALLLLGEESLYRGFLDPRRLQNLQSLLDGDQDKLWLATFKDFLGGVQAKRTGRLIVKSPNHLFRLGAIHQEFPHAAFLVMLRDPAETYLSNIRMWNDMVDLHGLWPAPVGAIQDFVIAAMVAAARQIDHLADLRSSGLSVAVCRFERIMADPVAALAETFSRLGIETDEQILVAMRVRAAALRATPRTVAATLPPSATAACLLFQASALRLISRD